MAETTPYFVVIDAQQAMKLTLAALELLMEAQRHKSSMEQGEREAGEDL